MKFESFQSRYWKYQDKSLNFLKRFQHMSEKISHAEKDIKNWIFLFNSLSRKVSPSRDLFAFNHNGIQFKQ